MNVNGIAVSICVQNICPPACFPKHELKCSRDNFVLIKTTWLPSMCFGVVFFSFTFCLLTFLDHLSAFKSKHFYSPTFSFYALLLHGKRKSAFLKPSPPLTSWEECTVQKEARLDEGEMSIRVGRVEERTQLGEGSKDEPGLLLKVFLSSSWTCDVRYLSHVF